MRKQIGGLLVVTLLVSGCGLRDSALNPFNWFGRSQPEQTTAENTNPLIPQGNRLFGRRNATPVYAGDSIGRITDLTIERLPGGAIVRARGISDRNGPYNARLKFREDGKDASTMTFDFEVITPSRARSTETERVRTVTVAAYLSDRELRGVRTIRVVAARNARVSRRR